MISVLMSVYHKEKPEYLDRALDSVMDQSEMPDEIVLVADGALTQPLDAVIKRYELLCENGTDGKSGHGAADTTPEFRVIRLAENRGLGPALAAGMRACRGDLIARMDTDDIAVRNRLKLQKAYMQAHPRVSAVGGDICEFETETRLDRSRVKHMPTGSMSLYRYGKLRNPLNHMTVMLRKADVGAVGGYRRRALLEDYDLWSRLLARGYRIDNIPEVLVYARLGEGFSARRGGLAYFKEYAGLRWMQLRIGYLHGWEYLIALAATAGMTLVPAGIREKVYGILRRG